jgi:hypothetical protein
MGVCRSRTVTVAAVLAFAGALRLVSAAGQAATASNVQLSENVFKNVQMLKGVPVDEFMDAMGMFSASLGYDCVSCHSSELYNNRDAFAIATPMIQRARQMIVMMNAINKQYFAGQPRVTCFTCHAGNQSPRSDPSFMTQYGTPVEDPNIRDFPTDQRIMPNQVFEKYIQAVGGADRLAKLTSYTAKGTYAGFDTSFDKVPVELYAKAPAQQTMIVHLGIGATTRTFDGRNGWMAGPDTPMPLVTLTEGNLDRARLEAMVAFPSMALVKTFPQWRGGRTALDDEEVIVLQGSADGQPIANFYFNNAGLLVRFIRWVRTPVGFVPTEVNYSDYRDVAGVKVPFKRTITQTYMQTNIELTDVQPNARVDDSRFAKPAPVKPAV